MAGTAPLQFGRIVWAEIADRERRLAPDAHILCMITGSGFKDPHSIEEMVAATSGAPLVSLEEFTRVVSLSKES